MNDHRRRTPRTGRQAARSHPKNVLIIDHDFRERDRLAAEFQRLGCRATTAAGDVDIVDIRIPVLPGLVVVDPGRQHISRVVRQLKTRFPVTRIVVATEQTSGTAGFLAAKLGAHRYLAKPVSAREILSTGKRTSRRQEPLVLLSLDQKKQFHVDQALLVSGGNKAKAARALGISRATLYRLMGKSASRQDSSVSERDDRW